MKITKGEAILLISLILSHAPRLIKFLNHCCATKNLVNRMLCHNTINLNNKCDIHTVLSKTKFKNGYSLNHNMHYDATIWIQEKLNVELLSYDVE